MNPTRSERPSWRSPARVVALKECRFERANTFGVGPQAFTVRAMPCAVIWPLAQVFVRFCQLAFFGEDGNPLGLQLCVRHAPSLPPQSRGTLRAHAHGLRDESPDPSTDLTPACPFCSRRGSRIADGKLEAWPNARVYRCARCHTEWAVAPQDHEPPLDT
jgi:hypothetical protein